MQVAPRVSADAGEVTDRPSWRIGFVALCAACTNTAPTSSSAHPGTGAQAAPGPATSSTAVSLGQPVVIATVLHFPPEVATPGPALAPELDRVAEVLHANPAVEVEIDGHADPEEAEAVAYARANLAASGLAGRGIPRTRMTLRSFGYRQPAADGKNRRVEFKVLPAR